MNSAHDQVIQRHLDYGCPFCEREQRRREISIPPRQKLVAQLRGARIATVVSSGVMVLFLTTGRTIVGTFMGVCAFAWISVAASTRRMLGR